ncbi:F-box/kelch-repeat protein At3g06240-like [Rutidosis leptorrhynchoides]|uniref:F-box/kelch-repeat protein At3g06240-like n=1 Tax=Rutidosis leptorrhynchoides TaxID=125765 RepID=UPI003A99CB71
MLGSCNGLVLLYDNINLCLVIVNPTTGKTLKVPKSGGGCNDAYGFGYDSSTDDYKVISFYRMSFPNSDGYFVSVYSLRNNSWRILPNCPYKQYVYHRQQGVLLNNILHFVARNKHSTMTIVAFSLADEEFHEIELPDSFECSLHSFRCLRCSYTCCNVFALGGDLVAVRCDRHFYELWVMEEYRVPKSWTKLCIFENDMDLAFELFAQVSNQDLLLGNNEAQEIFIYNMDERRCKSVAIEGCPEGDLVYNSYVESLESLERFGSILVIEAKVFSLILCMEDKLATIARGSHLFGSISIFLSTPFQFLTDEGCLCIKWQKPKLATRDQMSGLQEAS